MKCLTFSAALTIADAVRANPSREAGGLLLGSGWRIEQAVQLPNSAPEPECEFSLDPERMAAALHKADGDGLALLGTFHSHPNGNVEMSRADVSLARSTGLLMIVATGPTWRWALYDPDTRGEVSISIAFPYTQPRST